MSTFTARKHPWYSHSPLQLHMQFEQHPNPFQHAAQTTWLSVASVEELLLPSSVEEPF